MDGGLEQGGGNKKAIIKGKKPKTVSVRVSVYLSAVCLKWFVMLGEERDRFKDKKTLLPSYLKKSIHKGGEN